MDLPYLELASIAVCLFFSAFFSGAETALTSLSEVKVQQLIDKHPRWGIALHRWQTNTAGLLTTILIGNNIANVTASALATDLAGNFFANSAIPIAIGVMTFLLLFAGEITPKTFSLAFADSLALPLVNILMFFHVLFLPVGWVLTRFIRALLRLVGKGTEERPRVTEEDMEYAVSLGRRQGAIDQEKENLLISAFDFSETAAKEIMVPRTDMHAVEVGTPYDELVKLTLETGFSRFPVYEGSIDRVVGIFFSKSLLAPPGAGEKGKYLRRKMGPALFVPETKKISEVLKLFQRNRVHMAIVVDEFGGTEGVVTLEDIIEELLGEIHDEFDTEQERVQEIPGGGFVADARVEIEELETFIKIKFPEERGYESLGGFLMEVAGDVPAQGWQHEYKGHAFYVQEADLNRVIKVRIDRLSDPPGEAGTADSPPTAVGQTSK